MLVINHHAVRRFICFSAIINQHEFHLQSILRPSYQFFGMIRVITLVFLFLVRCRFPVQLSIISVLGKRYGDTVVKQVRKFEKLDFKYKIASLDLQFLQMCKSQNVIPNFLKFKLANRQLLTSNAYNICQKKLPYQEISNKYKLARNLNLELGQLKDSLRHDLNFIEFIQITTVFLASNNNIISKTKFFVPLLAPLTSNEYAIKDSFSFSKELLTFDSNLVLASFDIESLFTNISLKETTDLCVDILFSNTTNLDDITKDYFHELLSICMSESLVLFDEEFCKQIESLWVLH